MKQLWKLGTICDHEVMFTIPHHNDHEVKEEGHLDCKKVISFVCGFIGISGEIIDSHLSPIITLIIMMTMTFAKSNKNSRR